MSQYSIVTALLNGTAVAEIRKLRKSEEAKKRHKALPEAKKKKITDPLKGHRDKMQAEAEANIAKVLELVQQGYCTAEVLIPMLPEISPRSLRRHLETLRDRKLIIVWKFKYWIPAYAKTSKYPKENP